MQLLIDAITKANERTVGYAKKLLTGIEPDKAARFPQGADGVINTNHPAFVYGHLALYPERVLNFVKQDPAEVSVPEGWSKVFDQTAQCMDDPEGKIYPPFEEITKAFFDGYPKACAAIRSADPAVFAEPCPVERYQQAFGSTAGALNYLMNNHLMNHFGQLSAWRRMMGLGPA